jgi:hypothetical protein
VQINLSQFRSTQTKVRWGKWHWIENLSTILYLVVPLMLTPEPYVANLTSFWYTQRASTLVLLCQACKIIQLRCRLHEVVLTLLLCVCVWGGGGGDRVAIKVQTSGAILDMFETCSKYINWKHLQRVNWLYLNICGKKFALLWENLGLFLSNWIYELHILCQLLVNTTIVKFVMYFMSSALTCKLTR